MALRLSFSDSESTGDSRDTVEAVGSPAHVNQHSQDDLWMNGVMDELDEYMHDAPTNMLMKWRGIKTLTAVYYDGLKATQLELEQESQKVFKAQEAAERATTELQQVQAKLVEVERTLAEVQADRDALAALQKRVQDMVMGELERWEIVVKSDDESE